MQVKLKSDGPPLLRDCSDCPIRHKAVCALCEPDELAVLEAMKSYRTHGAGETIFHAGDSSHYVATIVVGVATLSRTLEDGRRQTVGLLLPGDFIGRPGRKTYPFDVVATSPVTLCRFERGPFEQLIRRTPSIVNRLLAMTLDELDAAREWAVVLGRLTAREKVAAFLVSLARRSGEHGPGPMTVDMPLTREAMADHLGLTLETASRQISALRRDGMIELQGRSRIVIADIDALTVEAGDDSDGGEIV